MRVFQNQSWLATVPRETKTAWEQAVSILAEKDVSTKWFLCIRKMAEMEWRIGPTHGDLTALNVMEQRGECKLIDLDRFSWEGLQIFDFMHYAIEDRCKTMRVDWIAWCSSGGLLEMLSYQGFQCKLQALAPGVSMRDAQAVYILERIRHELHGSPEIIPNRWKMRCAKMLQVVNCTL